MLKSQSGLSSPSLVRKHLGANHNNNHNNNLQSRKNADNGRNEFEEMLLQRREKILNGNKYSIGDKTPNGNSVDDNNTIKNNNLSASVNKWNTSSNT